MSGSKARDDGVPYAILTVASAFAQGGASVSPVLAALKREHYWSGEEFMAAGFPESRWLVERVWVDRNIGFLAGEPKLKKTWIALDLAFSVSAGVDFLETFTVAEPGPVVMIQKEDPEDYLQERLAKIAGAKGYGGTVEWSGQRLHIVSPRPFPPLYISTDPEFMLQEKPLQGLDQWMEEIVAQEGRPIRLLVLDPLFKLSGDFDEFRATETLRAVFHPLLLLREKYQCSIITVHHESKGVSSEARGGKRMYGSVALHAFAESALYVRRGSDENVLEVEPEFKSRAPRPFIITFKDLEKSYSVAVDFLVLTVETLSTHLKNEARPVTVEEIMEWFGKPQATVRGLLNKCIETGRVLRLPGARGQGKPDSYVYSPSPGEA